MIITDYLKWANEIFKILEEFYNGNMSTLKIFFYLMDFLGLHLHRKGKIETCMVLRVVLALLKT